jgi:choline dehydrogenase-like flavoprotein
MSTVDYIIIGAGSAGCVIAARLAENPDVEVLLLEAGGSDRSVLFHWPAGFARMTKGIASWGWSTVPQRQMQNRVLWFTQARVIGGGSSINAQIYTRGNRRDYDGWAEAGAPGWSYADVLPYFRRAEGNERFADAYHGTDGPLGVSMPRATLPICDAFIRAGQEWGMPYNPDFNGATQAGVGFYQLTQRAARRSSTATAYLRGSERQRNLTVRTGAQVRRIRLHGGRAVGVELMDGSVITAHSEVILAAGAIGSPRLLQLSGIGPADHLRPLGIDVLHDLPGVGENLQDHVDLCALAQCTGPHSYDGIQRLDRTIWAGLQYLLFRTGPVAASLFETGCFAAAGGNPDRPDIQFHLGQGSGIEKGIAAIKGWGITLNSAYLRPASRGTVRLASADPTAHPLIDPNYWAEPQDLEKSLKGLQMAREILCQPALRPFVSHEVLPGKDLTDRGALFDYACRMAKTDHHPVGTCRMGTDEMAVVDPALRLRGIDGLRVCDASVMPLIPSSNTNAPTIMIAEKASDLIRGLPDLPAARLGPGDGAATYSAITQGGER